MAGLYWPAWRDDLEVEANSPAPGAGASASRALVLFEKNESARTYGAVTPEGLEKEFDPKQEAGKQELSKD